MGTGGRGGSGDDCALLLLTPSLALPVLWVGVEALQDVEGLGRVVEGADLRRRGERRGVALPPPSSVLPPWGSGGLRRAL